MSNAAAANTASAPKQPPPPPTKKCVSIPPAIFVAGAEGHFAEEIAGSYCLPEMAITGSPNNAVETLIASRREEMARWKFCYYKGGDLLKGNVLCYGENQPELADDAEEEGAGKGLLGWVIGWWKKTCLFVAARCIQDSSQKGGAEAGGGAGATAGFVWEVRNEEGEFIRVPGMAAQPLHPGTVTTASVKAATEKLAKSASKEMSPSSLIKRDLGMSILGPSPTHRQNAKGGGGKGTLTKKQSNVSSNVQQQQLPSQASSGGGVPGFMLPTPGFNRSGTGLGGGLPLLPVGMQIPYGMDPSLAANHAQILAMQQQLAMSTAAMTGLDLGKAAQLVAGPASLNPATSVPDGDGLLATPTNAANVEAANILKRALTANVGRQQQQKQETTNNDKKKLQKSKTTGVSPSTLATQPKSGIRSLVKLRADAPVFIPSGLSPATSPKLGAVVPATAAESAAKNLLEKQGTLKLELEMEVQQADEQGIKVLPDGKTVTWDLAKVREKLLACPPGEGVGSSLFRLPNAVGVPGPPMRLMFFPFGYSKSPSGCVAVAVDCPQGARMKFSVGLGELNSGAKVLMGNRFHIDFDGDKLSEDDGVVHAIKFHKLTVKLVLDRWL